MPVQKQYNSNFNVGQEYFTPDWGKFNFADFKGADMDLISRNAEFAQNEANKRLDSLEKQRASILESVKLNKRLSHLEEQLLNNINGVLDDAGKVQLSDAKNFTKLNSNIISIKNDPILKDAINTTEKVKAYMDIRMKNPEVINQPWNHSNERNFAAFENGETDSFELGEIFKEVDLTKPLDEFMTKLSAEEKKDVIKFGKYSLAERVEKGIPESEALKKLELFKKQKMMDDPEIGGYVKRKANYFSRQNKTDIDYNIDDIWNRSMDLIIAAHPQTTSVGHVIVNPDVTTSLDMQKQKDATLIAQEKNNTNRMKATYTNMALGGGVKLGAMNSITNTYPLTTLAGGIGFAKNTEEEIGSALTRTYGTTNQTFEVDLVNGVVTPKAKSDGSHRYKEADSKSIKDIKIIDAGGDNVWLIFKNEIPKGQQNAKQVGIKIPKDELERTINGINSEASNALQLYKTEFAITNGVPLPNQTNPTNQTYTPEKTFVYDPNKKTITPSK